jgi:hypothetical protein
MHIEEHFYTDDPAVGHPDVRTRLSDTDYFFIGNGLIHAAIQVCRSGEGTPVGLLVMNPDRFGPKRAALTCDEDKGLEGTGLKVGFGGSFIGPAPATIRAAWEETNGVPTVRVVWEAGNLQVTERFFCPDMKEAKLIREVEMGLVGSAIDGVVEPVGLHVANADPVEVHVSSGDGWPAKAVLVHRIRRDEDGPEVESRWADRGSVAPRGAPLPFGAASVSPEATRYWTDLASLRTGDDGLDHLFAASRNHLPAAVDGNGRMDGSIWQYNLEWVRDQAHVAEAFIRLGDHGKARTMLARLVDEFVSPEGDTVDSGRSRPTSDVELDQNGELLLALRTYVDWTGDVELVESRWEKVRRIAAFPFTDPFLHPPSGLLHNQREYWERHGMHGIEDGFELMSQFFVAEGLMAAARLADELGHGADGERWKESAHALKRAIVDNPTYRLIENGHLIKRRGTNGVWQQSIQMESDFGLPEAIPLLQDGIHSLDPDASSALPIAHGFVDPKSEVASATLNHIEELWNQWWNGGGYGRYHASSEPDSPGAWPFASLFVARAYVETGEYEKVWRILRWLASTPGGASGAWFENDGPRIAPPYPQVGFTPWTWAEMITLFVHHLLGVRPDRDGITIRPRLLSGLAGMESSLVVRGYRLQLWCRAADPGEERGGWLEEMGTDRMPVRTPERTEPPSEGGPERRRTFLPWTEEGVRIPLPSSDIFLEISC